MAKQTNPNRRVIRVVSRTGGTHRTIGGALQSAPAGAIIRVRPGLYREGLVLREEVEIVGDGPLAEVVVESEAAPCITMATRRATVRGLTLRGTAGRHGGHEYAVDVPFGRLVLVACDITSDSRACVAIHGERASPILHRCRIHGGAQAGVFVYQGGKGEIRKCEITANKLAAVQVEAGSDPTIRNCKIQGGLGCGVLVHDGGKGTIEGCEIDGNLHAGVQVSKGGDPTVRRCVLRAGQESGVFIYEQGKGTFERCHITGNLRAGVTIQEGGDPTIRECSIIHNTLCGVDVRDGGKGTVVGCDLRGNGMGPWEIGPDCELTRRDNLV